METEYYLVGGDSPQKLEVVQYCVINGKSIIYLRPTVIFDNAVLYKWGFIMEEYIILYNTNEYKFMQAPNIVGLCKLWYEYVEDEMTGVTLRIWEKFKPEKFEDCIAWINSLLYPSNRIDGVIHGMWLMAKPSKE